MEGTQRTIIRAVVFALSALAATGPLAACGDADGADRQMAAERVSAALDQLQRSFAADDIAGICAGLSARARRQAGRIAHGSSKGCARDVQAFLVLIDEGEGWGHPPPRSDGVAIADDMRNARATLKLGRWRAEAPFVEDDGSWKLDSFFGSAHDSGSALSVAVQRRARPARRGGLPRARYAPRGWSPAACPPIFTESFPEIGGTCDLTVDSKAMKVRVLTALGDLSFDTCTMTYRIAADEDGRTWVHRVHVDAPPGVANNGCSDIRACSDRQARAIPWKGGIETAADGSLTHRFDICLDTCVGLYDGVVTTRLVRRGRHWTAVANRAEVGMSGFRFDGRSRVTTNGVTLTAARPSGEQRRGD